MNDPVKVYDADNGPEAEMIREALQAGGIEAYVETIASPLDGLTAMGQGTPIFVSRNDVPKANNIIEAYLEHTDTDDGDDDDGDDDFDDDDEDTDTDDADR